MFEKSRANSTSVLVLDTSFLISVSTIFFLSELFFEVTNLLVNRSKGLGASFRTCDDNNRDFVSLPLLFVINEFFYKRETFATITSEG